MQRALGWAVGLHAGVSSKKRGPRGLGCLGAATAGAGRRFLRAAAANNERNSLVLLSVQRVSGASPAAGATNDTTGVHHRRALWPCGGTAEVAHQDVTGMRDFRGSRGRGDSCVRQPVTVELQCDLGERKRGRIEEADPSILEWGATQLSSFS